MISEEIFYIALASIYSLLNLTTLIFSLIIIFTIACNWHTQFRSVSNLLICNSSTICILYAISCFIQIPFMFLNDRDSVSCQLRGFFTLYTAATQVMTYVAQAIFRYFCTIHYRRKILLTYRVNITIILLGWIIPLIFAGGALVSPYAYQYEPESRLCFLTTKYLLTSGLIGFCSLFTPINTIILLYGLILRKITRDNQQFQSNAINLMRYKRNIKVFHNILISVGIVVVCGTPYILSIIMNVISTSPWILYPIIMLSISMAIGLQTIALFLTTNKVKETFYAKIGYRRTEIQGIELRRRDQVMTVENQIRGNRIVPINNDGI